MAESLKVDICVIGAGSGGLSVAAGASQLGASTVLIERHRMGGDCLNYGCVPSKALLAAGRAAADARRAGRFGISIQEPYIDFAAVNDHVHGVIGAIAPTDSVARFEGLGVRVIKDTACFTGRGTVQAGDIEIRARRFVVATGSAPFVPPVPGLDSVPFLTNETIFENRERPNHLLVIGGGPIGCEMAQAHRRLGCEVTLVEMLGLLPLDDPELAEVVALALRREGVRLLTRHRLQRVARDGAEITAELEGPDGHATVRGTHILVAVGRRPNLADLNLEAAGIEHDARGIKVDAGLRTSNRRVYAIGDAAGGLQFTHVANYHAGIVLRSALFRLPVRTDTRAVPRVTYTDPELASVGLSEVQAREATDRIRVLRWPLAENDRAQAERDTEGLIKVLTDRRGRILGAGIAGPNAGDLIQPWTLAIANRMKIGKMANAIAPYPTRGEISKRAAGSYYLPGLFSPRTKKIVQFLARFG